MISINVDEKDGEFILDIKGHSETAEKGKNIVCAAVSILVYTLAEAIEYFEEDNAFEDDPKVMLEDGDAHISCIPYRYKREEVEDAYLMVMRGFGLLAHNYPQEVELTAFDEPY